MPGRIRTAASILLSLLPGTLAAQPVMDAKYYDVTISGLPIGHVEYEATAEDGTYGVQGFLGSSGFFGFFIGARYSGAATGRIHARRLEPEQFRGRFEARGGYAQVDVNFENDRPSAVGHLPPRATLPSDIPLSRAKGALDPISALYQLLRDHRQEDVCAYDVKIFDGVRLSRVALGQASRIDDGIRCTGVYWRLDGFTEEQLAERSGYGFMLDYLPGPDGRWRVGRFLAATDYGVARATLADR